MPTASLGLVLSTIVAAYWIGAIPFVSIYQFLQRRSNLGRIRARLGQNPNLLTRIWGTVRAAFPEMDALFALNALKGALAIGLAHLILFRYEHAHFMYWACGLATVMGDSFSPWTGFKMRRGVACAFGMVAVLAPWAAVGGLASYWLTDLLGEESHLARLVGIGAAGLTLLVFYPFAPYLLLALLTFILLLISHEEDLDQVLGEDANDPSCPG